MKPRPETTHLLMMSRTSFDEQMVTIFVGPERHKFFVHKSHLESTSAFFRAALQNRWQKGKKREIVLPEDKPDSVHQYLHFLYTGKIACHDLDAQSRSVHDDHDPEGDLLIDLYVLGEKYQDSCFKNALMDAIISKSDTADPQGLNWYFTKATVDDIYNNTTSSSPIRKLVVDQHVAYGERHWLADSINHPDFLLDLARKLLDVQRDGSLNIYKEGWVDHCDYHEHEEGEICHLKREHGNKTTNDSNKKRKIAS